MVGYTDNETKWINLYDSKPSDANLKVMTFDEAVKASKELKKPLWYNGYDMEQREKIRAINEENGFDPLPWE